MEILRRYTLGNVSEELLANPERLCIPRPEAVRSEMAVAMLSGVVAGFIVFQVCRSVLHHGRHNTLLTDGAAAVLGYLVARFVCEYLFPATHRLYGGNRSKQHRYYDAVAVLAAVVTRRYLMSV
jgi:hypothetical protein